MGTAWSDVIGDSSSEDGHNDPLRWEGRLRWPFQGLTPFVALIYIALSRELLPPYV